MSFRTFLALDLDEEILDALGEAEDRIVDPLAKMSWTPRSNLHVTLHFLGDVMDDMITEVCEIMADVAAQVDPFDFEVQGLAAVPGGGPLRMIWAKIADPTGEMGALHELLGADLSNLGLRIEQRRFQPHVTLARIKYAHDPRAIRAAAALEAETDFGHQHVSEVVAYTSQLSPGGSIYTPICRAPLGA